MVRRRDTLVLCSDGLSGQVRIDEIARVATDEPDLIAVCKQLIDRANANGGPDNITVIAARFDGDALTTPEVGDSVGHKRFALSVDSEQTAAVSRRTTPVTIKTTAETPTPRRATLKIPSTPMPEFPPRPMVSPARKIRGSLIALGLVVAFLVVATWYAYRTTASIVAPERGKTAVPATP